MKRKVLLSAATLATLAAYPVDGALAVTATMSAKALIIGAESGVFATNLHFGNLLNVNTASTGTVTLAPTTANRVTGGAGGLALAGSGPEADAVLSVNSTQAFVDISVTDLPVEVVHTTQVGNTMKVTAFQLFATDAGSSKAMTLPNVAVSFPMPTGTDIQNINIGGTLFKPAGALPAGTYKSANVTWNINFH